MYICSLFVLELLERDSLQEAFSRNNFLADSPSRFRAKGTTASMKPVDVSAKIFSKEWASKRCQSFSLKRLFRF